MSHSATNSVSSITQNVADVLW